MHHKLKEIGADFLLLLVAVAWGSTFFIVQDAVGQTPVYTFLAYTAAYPQADSPMQIEHCLFQKTKVNLFV